MQTKEAPDVSYAHAAKCSPPDNVVALAVCADASLGVQRPFSARIQSVRDDRKFLIASRRVQVLVGGDGELWDPVPDRRGLRHARGG
ncbi:hypothetical protein CCGE525_26080 (plasmid) [Rhizobium jaguaris]|uniref:Uncharacterized protein n=1 Tax=Rhizobium jaguaris TaxID=1312183 RepID=A0A387FUC8_9HYPH|nr:hypothetical protein CCGE525_26080 [Rhizobium jaguaris]